MTPVPQRRSVPSSWSSVPGWWDWNRSAQARQASLVGTAFIVLFPALLGPLFMPVAMFRGASGFTQTLLNRNLSLSSPLPARAFLDWLFFAGFMGTGLAAYWAPALRPSLMGIQLAFLPALLCYAMIQHRAVGLSRRAADREARAAVQIRCRMWESWTPSPPAEPEPVRLAA